MTLPVVRSVSLFEYADELKADAVRLQARKLEKRHHPQGRAHHRGARQRRRGHCLAYEVRATGEERSIEVAGIFVQIGLIPNSSFVDGALTSVLRAKSLDAKGATSMLSSPPAM